MNFIPDARPKPHFGFTADRWWVDIRLPPNLTEQRHFLRLEVPDADLLQAFGHCGPGPWQSLPRLNVPFAVFPIGPFAAGCEVLIMEETRAISRFAPIQLADDEDLVMLEDGSLIGAAIGISIAVSAFAGFLWTTTRRPEFLFFIAFQLATSLVNLRIRGLLPATFLDELPRLGSLLGSIGLNLSALSIVYYVSLILHIPNRHPNLFRAILVFSLSFVVAIIAEAAGARLAWRLTYANVVIAQIAWVGIIVLSWHSMRIQALRQAFGYVPTMLNIAVFGVSILLHVELVSPRPLFLLGQIGTALALAAAMAQEFKVDRDRRERLLRDTVTELEMNRTELQHYQGDLEAMVTSRTVELQRALQSERAIVAQQRDFTAMIGHEFRTPLAVIDGQARRIARADGREDDLIRRAREIHGAVHDMIGLMDGLLFHARHD